MMLIIITILKMIIKIKIKKKKRGLPHRRQPAGQHPRAHQLARRPVADPPLRPARHLHVSTPLSAAAARWMCGLDRGLTSGGPHVAPAFFGFRESESEGTL